MKYRNILIRYNVYLKKLYFTCEIMNGIYLICDIGYPFAFSLHFLEPTSDFQTPITLLIVYKKNKVWVIIFLIRSQGKFSMDKLGVFHAK